MKQATIPHRRGSPVRYVDVLASLRREILGQELQVADRLPTREALAQRFGTTRVTIQKAFDRLAAEGLVRTEGSRGTFVAATRPLVREYALTLPWTEYGAPSAFYNALRREAGRHRRAECHVSAYQGINPHAGHADYQRLRGLVEAHRVTGIIFGSNPRAFPASLEGSPLLTEPHIARVAIEAAADPGGIPSVYPDLSTFRHEALAKLVQAGRRRIAHLLLADPVWQVGREAVRALSESLGLALPDAWLQGAPADTPELARYIVEQWWREPATSRPDALIVHDDNLVPEATRGLAAAGARVPDEIAVVAHTNFPYPTPSAVPVTRLGYDIRRLMEICFERLDQQRRGDTLEALTLLPPVWAEDAEGSGFV